MGRGKSVAVYGAKGGIGKTTFVLSLAGVLSNMNKKVLIIDLDLSSGAIACSLNKEPNKTVFNFVEDYVNNKYDNLDKYVTVYDDNISFISNPKDPRHKARITSKYLDILVDKCLYKYDVVLIDTSHTLDEVSVFALDKCDLVYFMTSNDVISLKNLKNVINLFDDNEFNNYKIILNNSVVLSKVYFSKYDIKSILGHNVDYVISECFHVFKLDELLIKGKLITYEYKKFKDLKVFNLIADEIVGE